MVTRTEEGIAYAYMAAMQQAERSHCFMHDSDPVSPKSYWLPVFLIPPVQPIGDIATVSDGGGGGRGRGRRGRSGGGGSKRVQRNRGEGR